VTNRHHIPPCAIDFAVDEPLGMNRDAVRVQRRAIEIVFQDIPRHDQCWYPRTGHHIAFLVFRVTGADMTESFDHAFTRHNTIGDDKITDHLFQFCSGSLHNFRRRCGRTNSKASRSRRFRAMLPPMGENQLHLLKTKRFLPLLITFFLGAANDNFFRNAIVILILYRLAENAGIDGELLVTLAAGIFILPFFLFSATAGQLADKYEKSGLIRRIKLAEIAIMVFGAVGLILDEPYFLLFVLFLMGAQSSFFGPVKYSILPLHLKQDELIGGNALMTSGTFVAILLGTIAGALMILWEGGVWIIGCGVLLLAVIGWLASQHIPSAPPANPDLFVSYNLAMATWRILRLTAVSRPIFLSVLGISWFWVVGATLLSQFPNLAKFTFHANNEVVTLFLATCTVGIAVGSLLCNQLLRGEISAKYLALSAFGVSLFLGDLWFSAPTTHDYEGAFRDIPTFLEDAQGWRALFDIFAISICGGLFTVPLYAILQSRTADGERSRIIAGNNILNALFMVLSSLAATAMLVNGAAVPEIFLAVAIGNLVFIGLFWRLR
jgi:acyl-[acyl-carrier-protein]-phospholipid O-acyltransferase/long-chain-fatty-acid--[acyl-carrier-protein] ligase